MLSCSNLPEHKEGGGVVPGLQEWRPGDCEEDVKSSESTRCSRLFLASVQSPTLCCSVSSYCNVELL